MTKINTIWKELENDSPGSSALLLRRYSPAILTEAFIGLRQPEKIRCIAVRIKDDRSINTSAYGNLKDIKVELIQHDRRETGKLLLILLANQQHEDIFGILCEDLMSGIENIADEQRVIKELLNRLEKWKSLFEMASLQGLTQQEQRGLYGELYFLRKWLRTAKDLQKPVTAWLGPGNNIRDFQLSDWGIEVKTSQGSNHQKIQINGERQLDTSTLQSLFLFHLSLDVQQKNGETLNQITDSLFALLIPDMLAQNQFRSKLLQSGYFKHHRELYETTGYKIRQETWYTIKDEFPRIEERDIRKGVGDVTYSIILSEYSRYIVNESLIFELIE